MSSWIGQYLLRQHNIFVNGVMLRAVGDRGVLTPEIMAHCRRAQPSPAARAASAALPWLHRGRERLAALDLAGPCRLRGQAGACSLGLEGHRVPRKELERWKSALQDVELHEFEDCGHFLAEEAPGGLWRRFGGSWGARRARATPAPCAPAQRVRMIAAGIDAINDPLRRLQERQGLHEAGHPPRRPRRRRQVVHPPQPDPARQRCLRAVAPGGSSRGRRWSTL